MPCPPPPHHCSWILLRRSPGTERGGGRRNRNAAGTKGNSSVHTAGRQHFKQEPSSPSLQTQRFRIAETTLSGEQELIKFTGIIEEEII